jgi:hypothetical protein
VDDKNAHGFACNRLQRGPQNFARLSEEAAL